MVKEFHTHQPIDHLLTMHALIMVSRATLRGNILISRPLSSFSSKLDHQSQWKGVIIVEDMHRVGDEVTTEVVGVKEMGMQGEVQVQQDRGVAHNYDLEFYVFPGRLEAEASYIVITGSILV